MSNLFFVLGINGVAFACWLFLLIKDKKKGMLALKIGWETISEMIPLIIILTASIGLFSNFISPQDISKNFGETSGLGGFFFVAFASSFLQVPGILAYPIAATLWHNGVAVGTVAVFACSSTMASIFTLPLEIKCLGKRFAFVRVGLTYIIAISVGLLMGIIYHLL